LIAEEAEGYMKRKYVAFVVVLLVLMQATYGCGKTIVITQTEILTIPGPVTTTTQTINITGPVTTTTQTTTVPGPVTTTTLTTTVPGPTTTVTQMKTGIPAQGVIYITSITPVSPSTLHFGEKITITFEYVVTEPGGAYIWAQAYTNGKYTPNGYYQPSPLHPVGRGTTSRYCYVGSGSVKVDEIRISMGSNITLFEAFIPVDYSYIP
jgi:hypothetical protein